MIVDGTGGASLYLSGVEIEFVSVMNSTVLILGGKVILEDVKINNQLDSMWVAPLVFSYAITSSVTINLYSCTIVNSTYQNSDFDIDRSAVVFFVTSVLFTYSVTLNISFCLCMDTPFNLSSSLAYGGGFAFFCSKNITSSMCFCTNKKQ
jgi:hypothetical protein